MLDQLECWDKKESRVKKVPKELVVRQDQLGDRVS